VLDAIGDPLLIVDGLAVTHANAAARTLLGAVAADDDIRLSLRHPAAAGVLHGREDGPVTLAGLGGLDRKWELVAAPLGGTCRLLRLTDRSGQRAAERMRVDFVANASHELRTPLATLIGFIETLEEANGPADTAVRRRFLRIMDGEARRMQRLIDDLMSLSRIEADRYSVPRTRADLGALTRIAVAELRTGQGGDRIELLAPDEPAELLGDPGQLSQLVHNIVNNALKYARPGTPVRVRVTGGDGRLVLSVADEGDGIAPEHLPRLTERFYRVDPGRSRAVGGTGLGLAITKHIVERHRGRLDIQSVVGQGTTVTVVLPEALPLS
jgi:two-component system phosphate regulon sensor histidine kinase PhoR